MVIENKHQYDELIRSIDGKEVAISLVRDDFRLHPAESTAIAASICYGSETYDIVFNHSETFEKLDPSMLACAKRFWTDDAKQLYHLVKLNNIYDVNLLAWCNNKQFEDVEVDGVFDSVYNRNKNIRNVNYAISLVKILELSRKKLLRIGKIFDACTISKSFLKYNTANKSLAKLESNKIKIIPNSFGSVYKNGYAYSNYNILTSTGRPSNTFSGVNLAALNKADGSRKNIVSRFERGMLVEFDYDAYHLRLLASILDYNFPLDMSVHQYLADTVYNCSYEESKTKSFQILYGNAPFSLGNGNVFFNGVSDLARVIEDYFNANKYFKSHIYKKPFNMEESLDVTKYKILNYYIQSFETERNLEVISKVNKILSSAETKMILYTYDSFLFDFNISEGKRVLNDIKSTLEDGNFPVKIKAGVNYHNMKDITEKLNGHK